MEYEKIIDAIENAPLTQVGAIMIKAVEIADKRKFFADVGALKRVVNRTVKKDNSAEAKKTGSSIEVEALKKLCRELLAGADKCGQEPHYIVQPFLGIVKRHAAIIKKHRLM